jgi:hypothetical protein
MHSIFQYFRVFTNLKKIRWTYFRDNLVRSCFRIYRTATDSQNIMTCILSVWSGEVIISFSANVMRWGIRERSWVH